MTPKKQNCNMLIIKISEERSLTYHPGGMAEISRGLREAIPPEHKTGTHFYIPEGWHRMSLLYVYFL